MLDNSSSCVDLIFTSQPNMVIDSGVHVSFTLELLQPNYICKVRFTDILSATI